jgi:hypothetical protein
VTDSRTLVAPFSVKFARMMYVAMAPPRRSPRHDLPL